MNGQSSQDYLQQVLVKNDKFLPASALLHQDRTFQTPPHPFEAAANPSFSTGTVSSPFQAIPGGGVLPLRGPIDPELVRRAAAAAGGVTVALPPATIPIIVIGGSIALGWILGQAIGKALVEMDETPEDEEWEWNLPDAIQPAAGYSTPWQALGLDYEVWDSCCYPESKSDPVKDHRQVEKGFLFRWYVCCFVNGKWVKRSLDASGQGNTGWFIEAHERPSSEQSCADRTIEIRCRKGVAR